MLFYLESFILRILNHLFSLQILSYYFQILIFLFEPLLANLDINCLFMNSKNI